MSKFNSSRLAIERHRRNYILVAIGVVLLIILSVFFLNIFAESLVSKGKIINLSGSQRMRSQRVTQLSLRYINNKEDNTKLKKVSKDFIRIQSILLNGNDSLGIKKETDELVLEKYRRLSFYFNEIYKNVEKVISTKTTKENKERAVDNIVNVQYDFLVGMDEIVMYHENEYNNQLLNYRLLVALASFLLAVIIILEVIFVFNPTYKKISSDFEKLSEMETVLKTVENTIIITDAEGHTIWVNDAFTRLTGYKPDDIIGEKPGDLLQGELTSKEDIDKIRYGLGTKSPFYVEIINYHRLGMPYWVNLQITPMFNAEGEIEKFISVQSDISERKNAEERIFKANQTLEEKNKLLESQKVQMSQQAKRMVDLAVELDDKHNTLKMQSHLLEQQNAKILDSINYAKRIQNAVLSDTYLLEKYFKGFYLLNKPKDVVSGDFFWNVKRENTIFLGVADCTGHGVPGAIMSTIGINLLNKVISSAKISKPSVILQALQYELRKTLKSKDSSIQDGMDIGIIAINLERNTLQYAGAHHSLYYVSNKDDKSEIKVLSGSRIGIGGIYSDLMKEFSNYELNYSDINKIYLHTDGVQDQFGSYENAFLDIKRDKKFTKKNLISLLNGSQNLSVEEQGVLVEKQLKKWQGERNQTDDMLMICLETNLDMFNYDINS